MDLTDEQKGEIRAAYRGGVGLRALAARYGVSPETIRAVCAGLPRPRRGRPPKAPSGGLRRREPADRADWHGVAGGDIARIPLYNRAGEIVAHAVVDAADAERLRQYRWHLHATGFAGRGARALEGRGTIWMHREVLGLSAAGRDVPVVHLNGDRLDNRRANLRPATWSDVCQRRRAPGGSSRFRHVTWSHQHRAWRVRVKLRGRNIHLGLFDDEEAAGRAAAAWRREHMPLSAEAMEDAGAADDPRPPRRTSG